MVGTGTLTCDNRQSVFFLVPELNSCGEGATARVLAAALPADQFRVTVGLLGRAAEPEMEDLKAAGIAIIRVSIRHAMDFVGVRGLRRVVREIQPDIIHAWGERATRAVRSLLAHDASFGNIPRLVVSEAANSGGGLGGWLAARQMRRADRVIPRTRADGDRYRRLGVPAEQLTLIAPAVPAPASAPDPEAIRRELDLPSSARLIVASGVSEAGIGPKDAIIAFDMLRYDMKDLYLVLAGAGAEAAALDRFGRSLAFDDFRVRFAPGALRAAITGLASAVFATSRGDGIETALEAMVAAKPVVGWANADLTEIVDDKVSGLLVTPGDRSALAAAARSVLDNPAYARRLGEAGRLRAAERFCLPRMVEQFARLYQELAPINAPV